MLLPRSIATSHLCVLVLFVATVRCQYYNSEYNVNDDVEDDDHSSYKEEDDRPDYSKYYKQDSSSSPLVAGSPVLGASEDVKDSDNGFVSPIDFSGFIGSSHFGLGAASGSQQALPTIPIQNPFHLSESATNQNTSGFVDPQEFQSGFSGSQIDLGPHNFEAEAQKIGQQFQNDAFEQSTGQTYTAPKVASTGIKNNKYNKQSYKSEADDLNNYKPVKYDGIKKQENYEKKSGYSKPNYDYTPVAPVNVPYTPVVPTLSSYTSPGKTSYASPIKTYTPQIFPGAKYTNTQSYSNPSLTPYQKYSFQPSASLPAATFENIKSTLAPYNPNTPYVLPSTAASYYASPTEYVPTVEYAQPTEYKSQKVKNSNCQKIAKHVSAEDISHGRFRRQADQMNCYVCTDPKTGGNYEQCSYTSDPDNDKAYFRGHAEKYSTKTYQNPEHSRERRSPAKDDRRNKRQKKEKEEVDDGETEEYVNPFDYQKKNSHKFSSKPDEFDGDRYYKTPDFSNYEKDHEDYRFGPEYFSDATNNEKSYSELQSEELKKNGENCKQVKKDSMTCMVCSNPKTGGNYEQCSYTSEPKEKKYAYVKEKKYNSNDPEGEEKTVESTETKPTIQKTKSRLRQKPTTKPIEDVPYHYSASTRHPKQSPSKSSDEYYKIPDHFHASSKDSKKSRIHNPERYSQAEATENVNDERTSTKEREDYVSKLFPEYAEKESRNRETKRRPGYQFQSDLPEYFTAEESKKDVDSVLQEFSKKDRSNCKKIAKDKMTCYLCVDAKGIQHEECMFVSESQPKSSHIAYHEVKEFSTDPKKNGEEETAGSNQTPEVVPTTAAKLKRKAFPKKVTTPIPIKDVDSEPTEFVKVVGKSPRIVRRKTNISKEYLGSEPQESKNSEVRVKKSVQQEQKEESEVNEPEIEGGEGAYASELVPKYSKKLGMTLPAYMLQISEGEKVFDEVMASGR